MQQRDQQSALSEVHCLNLSAAELGQQLAKQLIAITKVRIDDIDQTIVGCVLQAGIGLNIARQISVGTGVPVAALAFTVNEVCGSGLKALKLAANDIWLGNSHVVLVGGVQSMSRAPFLVNRTAMNSANPDGPPIDHIQQDGLVDPFSTAPMGSTAEVVTSEACVSREDQDVSRWPVMTSISDHEYDWLTRSFPL